MPAQISEGGASFGERGIIMKDPRTEAANAVHEIISKYNTEVEKKGYENTISYVLIAGKTQKGKMMYTTNIAEADKLERHIKDSLRIIQEQKEEEKEQKRYIN